jgi:hypothetical protein
MMATRYSEGPAVLAEALHGAVGAVDVQSTRRRGVEAELRLAGLPRNSLFSLRIPAGRLSVAEPRPFVGITVPWKGKREAFGELPSVTLAC